MKSRIRLLIMWVFRIPSPSMFGMPIFRDVIRGSMPFGLSDLLLLLSPKKTIAIQRYRPIVHGSVISPDYVEWEAVK